MSGNILLPMLVDAYVNYPASLSTKVGFSPTRPAQSGYLASASSPDFQKSLLDDQGPQHDIFDQVRNPPNQTPADPVRVSDNRGGIYVHWTLPFVYRTRNTASESADDSETTHIAVPNRWLISRTVEIPDIVYSWKVCIIGPDGKTQPYIDPRTNKTGPTVYSRFIVESDFTRDVSDISPSEDVNVSCSQLIAQSEDGSEQKQIFLGKCSSFPQWQSSPPNKNPFNLGITADPFFADYQPNNSSVFSWFDDLSSLNPNQPGQFVDVNVSYTVIGFYSDQNQDPLCSKDGTVLDRLDKLDLSLINSQRLSQSDANFLSSNAAATTLCHGSKLSTPWLPMTSKGPSTPSLKFPVDDVQNALLASHPVSVGTNPLDALIGWFQAKILPSDSPSLTSTSVIPSLKKFRTLLADLSNNFDTQIQAADLIGSANYIPSNGAPLWRLQSPVKDDQSSPNVDGIRRLNGLQTLLNYYNRRQTATQKQLFDVFWNYATQRSGATSDQKQAFTNQITTIKLTWQVNDSFIKSLTSDITTAISSLGTLIKATEPLFYTQRDPTLLIAGLKSKWPIDFDQGNAVRVPSQLFAHAMGNYGPNYTDPDYQPLVDDLQRLAPTAMYQRDNMFRILDEAENYRAKRPPWTDFAVDQLYHPSRDVFDGDNAWFPLFIDWEVEYYHIPFSDWEFALRGSESRIGYGIKNGTSVAQMQNPDYRILSGRSHIVPQSSSHLSALLKQLLTRLSPEQVTLTPAQQQQLVNDILGLDFLSTPMSGFTDQLITRMQGTHLSPIDYSKNPPSATDDAITIGQEIGLSKVDIELIGSETQTTPFSNSVSIPASYNPFKPCMHGQFRFRKLEVVDKFGQVASALRSDGTAINALFPGMGDKYSLQPLTSDPNSPSNCILPRQDQRNTFVQLPPSINQNARLNSNFVKRSDQSPTGWTATDEWDNPIIGWMVINDADQSFQIFTADGRFVREWVLSAMDKTWMPTVKPIAMDTTLAPEDNADLQNFIDVVMTYIPGLVWNTLERTAVHKHAAPTAFSGSMLSSMGRPIAIVNIGLSLELAEPPNTNESSFGSQPQSVLDYDFGVKFGDQFNVEDGLYIYWLLDSRTSPSKIDYWNGFSYDSDFKPTVEVDNDPRIKPPPFDQTLKPFYPIIPDGTPTNDTATAAKLLQDQRDAATKIIGAIVDPYRPTHFYTDLLPVNQLQIPSSAISDGLSRIAAYFQAGPVLVHTDVASFDVSKKVDLAYRLGGDNPPLSNGSVQIPSVPGADWAWLQPYWFPQVNTKEADALQGITELNVMDVETPPDQAKFESGPYVALEGYLQMKKPFQDPSNDSIKTI